MANKPACSTERPELVKAKRRWNIIQDALDGEDTIKEKTTKYLPRPATYEADSAAQEARYNAYLTRAVYYNVCKPTNDALVGQLFLRMPKINLPEAMQGMLDDINGEGLSFVEFVRKAANHVLPYGRCGFLADFPATNGKVTQADVEAGVRPTVRFIEPWAIINWKITKIGTQYKLTLLVIKEAYEHTEPDEFKVEVRHRYRVYRMDSNRCVTVEVWDETSSDRVESYRLCGHDGEDLNEIPFEFVGSENNDSEIDEPPLYSMAVLNIAHFRNSADYEESVFLVGQPTPVYSGLTEDWVANYFDKGVPFGSRAAVPLPEGATAQLLQAQPNSLAFEAMTHKEEQMIAIGAKIINPKQTVERKEAEIQIEAASQRSVLTTIKDNLESALLSVLRKAAMFVKVDTTEIELELNDNFDLTSMTAEELRWLIELFNSRNISFVEMHENLRRSGIVKSTPDEAKAEILKDQEFIDKVKPQEPAKLTTSPDPDNDPTE